MLHRQASQSTGRGQGQSAGINQLTPSLFLWMLITYTPIDPIRYRCDNNIAVMNRFNCQSISTPYYLLLPPQPLFTLVGLLTYVQ